MTRKNEKEEERRKRRSYRQRIKVFSTVRRCGWVKNRKLRRQTSAGSHTSIASQPSSMFRLSKTPKKVNKSAVLILLHHPSIFSHPTTLPLHPRTPHSFFYPLPSFPLWLQSNIVVHLCFFLSCDCVCQQPAGVINFLVFVTLFTCDCMHDCVVCMCMSYKRFNHSQILDWRSPSKGSAVY